MSLIPRHSMFDLDHLFDAPFPFAARPANFAPRVDVEETDSSYEISAELPGVDKKDIHLSLQNGVLTIEAESHEESKEEKAGKVIRQERRYGKFVRSLDLGPAIKESDIKASYDNGVLKLTAPKLNMEAQQARRIEVA